MPQYPFYTPKQEKANILTHILGVLFFIPAGVFLILHGKQFLQQTDYSTPGLLMSSLVLSVLGVLMNYTASICYHASLPHKRLAYRKFDHISIFWSIAGVYFPFIAVNYELTQKGFWLFYLMIGLATAGTLFKLFFLHVPKAIYTFLYVVMGWTVIFFGKQFFSSLPQLTVILLILGGVFYTVGVAFYLSKKHYYSHAIWHIFVVLGGISHYFSIWYLVA